MDGIRKSVVFAITVTMIGPLWAESMTRLEYSCRQGIIGVQARLKINNEAEYKEIAKSCVAYSTNDTLLLQDHETKEGEFKRSWECGLGIGAALRYYGRTDLIKDKDWMSDCAYNCVGFVRKKGY